MCESGSLRAGDHLPIFPPGINGRAGPRIVADAPSGVTRGGGPGIALSVALALRFAPAG